MTEWLDFTDEQRKAMINEAEQASGMRAKAIEKDWWVTLVLKALFQCKYKEFIVFKGGTSLSKGWNLISRFSEDIDLALSPTAFGMTYIEEPGNNYVSRLKKRGCQFTSNEFTESLKAELAAMGIKEGIVEVEAARIPEDFPDTDPQIIFVRYKSLYPANDYIADEVKVEVSVRSTRVPFAQVPLHSLLYRFYDNEAYKEKSFSVEAVEPRKTFLEKMFLLHEEFCKPDKARIRTERMSRHIYDLYKMSLAGIMGEALADHALYDTLVKHRENYSRISWVDYKQLGYETLSFLPIEEVAALYSQDYETMRSEMIYDETPPAYEELVIALHKIVEAVRTKYKDYPEKK